MELQFICDKSCEDESCAALDLRHGVAIDLDKIPKVAAFLVSYAADPQEVPLQDLFYSACVHGGPEEVEALVKAGADVNKVQGAHSGNALHMVAMRSNMDAFP